MAVVTVSRLMGAAGDEIAARVAQRLGYNFVDNGLIVRVAERAGVSVDAVRDYDEQSQSRAVEWLKRYITPKMTRILVGDVDQIDPGSFVEYSKTIIRGLAKEGNMVIVGRASQFILDNYDNAYHVRIIAAEPARISRSTGEQRISETEARDMIRKNDTMRRYYVERYFNADWENPFAYHLIIDSEKNGIEQSAAIIAEAVNKFSTTHEYIPGVNNRRKGDRRSGHERRTENRRTTIESWSHKDLQDALMRGRPVRSRSSKDRRTDDRRAGLERRSKGGAKDN